MGAPAGLIGLSQLLLLLLVLWWPYLGGVGCWKVDEFHKCSNSPFCKEARDRGPGSNDLVVQDVSLSKGRLRARLVPEAGGEALVIKISAYRDGIVRFRVQEEKLPSGKRRFEVPDVLEPNLEDNRLWLQRVTDQDGASVVHLSAGLEVVLQHRPFQLHVRHGGKNVVSVNSKGLFHFDHLREKQEGDNWEETFRSHKDSRPHGPQSVSLDVSFHGAEHVYGIPEHATSFALKPTRGPGIQSEPYRLFNLDVFEYIHESPFGLYGAVPFMLSHSYERTTGFFWLNSAEMLVDVMASGWDQQQEVAADADGTKVQSGTQGGHSGIDTVWTAESGMLDAFIFVGPGPKDVVKQYTSLTGTTRLPQLFSIAYHQCRWNYKDDADVAEVDAKFDEHNIPYDVIWLDIEHTDGKRYFTWDSILFPDPKEMQRKIAAKGRHMVTIVDPHIRRDDGFPLHKEATQKGYYVKDKHGSDYDGWCWPGSSSYLDMLDPEVRSWWADRFSFSSYVGSTSILYIWNDMNEPSVFNGPEATMPRDNIHYGDVEHRDVHNAYGYYFHMASADGLIKRSEGKDRPFVLSRAFFAGTQKVGPVWTGDNTGDWDHLRVSVPMILSLGVTGIAFSGADVGGFFGNPEPELLARFYQLGSFYPFFRAHAHLDTKRREPWLFGEPYTSVICEAVRTRYALLPLYYTLFKEASVSGIPVVRPLWMEFPKDERSFDIDDAFLVGNSLLVHGVYTKGATTETVYLPGSGPWYGYKTGSVYAGGREHTVPVSLDDIPIFQHGGTIIPRKDRVRRSSTQMENDPYTFVIALNSSSKAAGELYIDDGKSYEFEKGAYIHKALTFSDGRLCSSELSTSTSTGAQVFSTPSVVERIIIYGLIPRDWKTSHRAIIEKTSREVGIEVAPPLLRRGQPAKSDAVIVRAPNLPISEDWCLQIL